MIRKQLTISVIVAVVALSVVGGGAVTTGVLAAEETDDNDSRETATEMAVNNTETGTLEGNDTDWYAFEVEAGERIWTHLNFSAEDSTVLYENKSARFDIFGPSGDNVNEGPSDAMGPAYSPSAFTEAFGGVMAQQSGTYYIRVKGQNISDYDLTVETQRLDQYDPNEQPATAPSIESDETISAVMSGPDVDTYAIDLEEGETINVTASDSSYLVNTQLLGPNASDATVHRHHNEYVVTDEPSWSTQFNHTANASGTYFVRVYPYEEGIFSYDVESPYELSVTISGDEDDESPAEDDPETDDGTTETPDEEDSTDEDDSRGDDYTETPDDTEQPDSDESMDDGDTPVDETTDNTEQSDSNETVDVADDDASEQTEC